MFWLLLTNLFGVEIAWDLNMILILVSLFVMILFLLLLWLLPLWLLLLSVILYFYFIYFIYFYFYLFLFFYFFIFIFLYLFFVFCFLFFYFYFFITAPSTLIPSTAIPTSFACTYNVLNCEKCGITSVVVDLNQYSVSCVLFSSKWRYSFKNKNSETFQVNNNLNLSQNEAILVEGNFNQQSSSVISIILPKFRSNRRQSSQNSVFHVNGCVSLDGQIDLLVNERPSSNQDFEFELFSYNCSQTVQISDSQIKISSNYSNSNCDVTSKRINNQQNSLSVSLSSSLNKNCNGKKKIWIILFYLYLFLFLFYFILFLF